MSTFHDTLDAYLASFDGGEVAFAERLGTTQATVNRYRNGKRFPDASMARLIDQHSEGAVPFGTWQAEFFRRAGLSPASEQDAAA